MPLQTAQDPRRTKAHRDRIFLEIVIVFFWASEYCHAPYFTPYLNSLQMGATLVGAIVSCYGMSQMLARIPLGLAADATGAYRTIIILGLVCTTVSSLGLFLTTNVAGIFFFRVLAGLAASTWIATTVAYMAFFQEEKSVSASARLNALNNGGKLLAFVLGGVAASLVGYRITLFLSFAVGLVGLVLSFFVQPPPISKTPASLGRLLSMLATPGILAPALLMAVQQMILHATVFSFTSTVAKQVGAPTYMLSVLSAVFTLVQIAAARVIGGSRFQRIPRPRAIALGFGLLLAYTVILGAAPNVWVILAGQLLCAFGGAILASLLLAECVKNVPQGERSTAVGIFQAVYGLGMTLGPVWFGHLLEVGTALHACLLLAGTALLLAGATGSFLYLSGRKNSR